MAKNLKPLRILSNIFNAGLARKMQREAVVQGNRYNNLSILQHIQQLRLHVVRAFIWIFLFSGICFAFMKNILFYLKRPYEGFLQSLQAQGFTQNLTSLNIFEVMTVNFKMCFYLGFAASLPFILLELWKFVLPALYPVEKKIVGLLLLASMLLFYTGITFSYFLIIPYFFQSALSWASQYATVMISYESYFNSLTSILLIFAIIFEVPVFLSLLGLVGVLPAATLAKNRKIAFLGCFLVGAILAPPDAASLCLVALPMYGMVEISIFSLKFIEKKIA